MASTFKKATKAAAKLRLALFGPSGAGKTYTALRVAKGLGGKVAVIDTERGSASKYADRFEFDVCELEDKSIDGYIEVMYAAGNAGYGVLIIDSMSHGWQELLEQVDKLAASKYRGNSWSAWSEGTPKQKKFVEAILTYPGHVIATMRSKTEWTTSKNDRGKDTPVRVGLAPEQGKGIEYEFDMLLELSVEHVGNVLKDRTGKFQDKLIDKPGEEFGRELAAWLADAPQAPTTTTTTSTQGEIPGGTVVDRVRNPPAPRQGSAGGGTETTTEVETALRAALKANRAAWTDADIKQLLSYLGVARLAEVAKDWEVRALDIIKGGPEELRLRIEAEEAMAG